MREWLDAIPNLGVPGVPGVPAQTIVGLSGTRRTCKGVPGVPPEHLQLGGKPQKSATKHLEHLEHPISEQGAPECLDVWHRHLSRLDVYEVPDGFDQNRWGQLVLDAWWLYEEWASRLVRDGWTALDLFGVIPSQRGWGGLADRLQGSRSLLIDDTGKAYWRRMGVSFELSRGLGEALRGSDARLLWNLNG